MAEFRYTVSNPKGSSSDLRLTFLNKEGVRKPLGLVKPGESLLVERSTVQIIEVPHPLRLEVCPDGTFRKDSRSTAPSLKPKS